MKVRTQDPGQGEDVTDVFMSLVTAATNGNVVCFIAMRALVVFENISAKTEAFVWEGAFHCEAE